MTAPRRTGPNPRPRLGLRAAPLVPLAGAVLLAGCASPLDGPTTEDHRRLVERVRSEAAERELAATMGEAMARSVDLGPTLVEETLSERRTELDELTPAGAPLGDGTVDPGPDLAGDRQALVDVGLTALVNRAVRSSLGAEQARYQRAINAEDVLDAEAAFDWLLFADASASFTDEPAIARTVNGVPLGQPFDSSKSYRFETGLSKRTRTGGAVNVTADLTRFENRVTGVGILPSPAYTSSISVGASQSLLRGFGSDVATAQIRLAENSDRRATLELERTLLDLVEDVEQGYFDLYVAWRRLEVAEWLVRVGVEVRDVLEKRRAFDTRDAQYSDAVARVEQREADVIRARRAVRAASDRLKLLVNDADLSVGSEELLRPADAPATTPIEFALREQVARAVEQRPSVAQTLLTVDDAEVRRLVAANDVLPVLDLGAEIAFTGLDDDPGTSSEAVLDDEFVSYLLTLRFEQPLGNRGAEARARAARLSRAQALVGYRAAVRGVVLEVKSALRDVVTNLELSRKARSNRVAQAESLRALLVEKQTLAGLTPEFLNLEFQRQESLARARIDEFSAEADYARSIAALDRATGEGLARRGIELERVGTPYGEAGDDPARASLED